MINVTVSIQVKLNKSPFYYAVIHWIDPIKQKDMYKWKTTKVRYVDVQQKRLYKQANQEAINKAEIIRKDFENEINMEKQDNEEEKGNILFIDYLSDWLKNIENIKAKTTFGGYQSNINSIIIPYFKDKQLKLKDISTVVLQEFFDKQYRLGKSARTVKHYYYNIRQVLEKARRMGLIKNNPVDECIVEKAKQYIPQIYNAKELKILSNKLKGNIIYIPTILAIYLGTRKSENLGIKWNCIDFDNSSITIAHTVTVSTINNKSVIVKKNIAKNNSSFRTLPIPKELKEILLIEKEKQERNKKIYGNTYKNKEDYVCVNEEGELIKPNELTKKFTKFLKDNDLRKIRYHDLRHSVGSMLVKEVSTRQVQQYLGHSNISTTEIYTHLDDSDKKFTSTVISHLLEDKC